jgi:hypothetical protein
VRALVVVYLTGALIALWRTDARPFERLLLAVLWPIGPIAFAVTVALLLAASPLAFWPRGRA